MQNTPAPPLGAGPVVTEQVETAVVACSGLSASLFGTGLAGVLATCTSVATKPCTAFGAASVNNSAINATTPRPVNILFANCILFLLLSRLTAYSNVGLRRNRCAHLSAAFFAGDWRWE